MMVPNMGIVELLISFVAIILGLAFPVTMLYLMLKLYGKVKNIEELLNKK